MDDHVIAIPPGVDLEKLIAQITKLFNLFGLRINPLKSAIITPKED
jgi:hypothetical protein